MEVLIERPSSATQKYWLTAPNSVIQETSMTVRKPGVAELPKTADHTRDLSAAGVACLAQIKALEPAAAALHSRESSSRIPPPEAGVDTQAPEPSWSRFRRRIKGPKCLWPNPHLSIGTECIPMGDFQCWEASGPAQELFQKVSQEIADLLDGRFHEIEGREPTAEFVTYGMYMIGKTQDASRPTLVLSCRREKPRRRALKFIKESQILKPHPIIKLAESSIPPTSIANDALRLFSGRGQSLTNNELWRDNGIPALAHRSKDLTSLDEPSNGIYGLPIVCLSSKARATIGGVIRVKDEIYGLTVAHVFRKDLGETDFESPQQDVEQTVFNGDHEFAFDIDDESESSDYEDFTRVETSNIHTTSQESLCSATSKSQSETTQTVHYKPRSEFTSMSIQDVVLYDRMRGQSIKNYDQDDLIKVGELFAASTIGSGSDLGYDWGLIKISDQDLINISLQRKPSRDVVFSGRIARGIAKDTAVQLLSNVDGAPKGTISSNITMMRLPYCTSFQEVWTVRLVDPIMQGGCGSWIIDTVSGDLYGHVVAGHSEGRVVYIIPAYRIFEDISEGLGVADLLIHAIPPDKATNNAIDPSLTPKMLLKEFTPQSPSDQKLNVGIKDNPPQATRTNRISVSSAEIRSPSKTRPTPAAFDTSHPHASPAIVDFERELNICTLRTPDPPVACGRCYIRVSELIKWLGSEVLLPKYRTTQASRLLEYAYHDWRGYAWPITREKLFDGENRCILVFCILLKLGWGDLVHVFRRAQFVDKHLPIPLHTLHRILRQLRREDLRRPPPNPDELAAAFDREQWQFCPAKFDLEDCPDFHRNRIIPILRKAKINDKGGTATLWQIEVLQEFVGKNLQEVVKASLYYIDEDHYGPRYHFALKVFNEGNRGICDNEIEAFIALREHTGMVRYLGGYNHQEQVMHAATAVAGERKMKATYNILLEYGDRDLDELFWEQLTPVLQNDIKAFWEGLFEIADAIKGIHNFKIDNDGIIKEYFGWHADIKPDNILEVQGKLKLADPGFARFREKASEQSGLIAPTVRLPGGAPELYPGRPGSNAVPQTIDIWSLGCVFSIAATWVALGTQGILQYTKLREEAIHCRIKAQQSLSAMKPECPKLESGDFFHDGLNVLSEVTEWHKYLRISLRKTDTITSEVLDLVDNHMLVGNPKSRMKASELCHTLSQISVKAKDSHYESSLPENILNFLLEVDKTIDNWNPMELKTRPGKPTGRRQTLQTSTEDQAEKPKDLPNSAVRIGQHPFLKSALSHRSDSSRQINTGSAVHLVSSHPSYMRIRSSRSVSFVVQDVTEVFEAGENIELGMDASSPSPKPLLSKSSTGFSQFPSMARSMLSQGQNVFQAYEELDRRKNKATYLFGARSKWKDPTLARYFKNRSIKFLVDNAESMDQHWGQVKHLLVALARKAVNLDDEGFDLSFTLGTVKAEHVQDESKILKKMCDQDAIPQAGAYTDIRVQLLEILDHYLLDAKRRHQRNSPFKNMTILVLTDGIWRNTGDKEDVNRLIINFTESLAKIKDRPFIGGDRPVSIEFIQFGRDPDATFRLKRLDDELAFDGAPDLVDTEHCTGDVNKMLLGSFVEAYDALGGTDNSMLSSSSMAPSLNRQDPFQTPETLTKTSNVQAGPKSMVIGTDQLKQHRNSVKSSRSSRFSFNR